MPRPVVGPTPPGNPWSPSFPDRATGRRVTPAAGPDATAEGDGWVPAPASSHLEAFRWEDERDRDTFRLTLRGRSFLRVRFRAKGKSPRTEYQYEFADPVAGAEIYAKMKAAESPGEYVPHAQAACTSYERTG